MGTYRGSWADRGHNHGPRTLLWLVTVIGVAALGLVMSWTGLARPVQSFAQDLALPITEALYRVTQPIATTVGSIGRAGKLRDENRDLHIEVERLQSELARAREDEIRAGELADLVNTGNRIANGQVTYAAIIARDPHPLRSSVAINRGTDEGVNEGMPVLGKGGALAGVVERAASHSAWVRLITDPQSSVNVQVQESRALGLVNGSAERTVRLRLLAYDAVIRPGDTVQTSGLGGSYPAGLLIGRVTRVEGTPADMYKRVEIETAAPVAALESVIVLTNFSPAPLQGLGR